MRIELYRVFVELNSFLCVMKLEKIRNCITMLMLFVVPHSVFLLCIMNTSISEMIYSAAMGIADAIFKF
tara:strand:+ start:10514 stop:10720 length:207 start_codon:yes stop_codon:yes gene_type:complete